MSGTADGQVTYNFATIGTAIEAIDTAIGSMRGALSQLERDLHPLETDAWTSQAQVAYKARKDRWTGAANHITVVLGQVKTALDSAAQRMRDTDRKAISHFES